MPMQIVFPIAMVAVGVVGAGALVAVSNHMLYHKVCNRVLNTKFVVLQTCND